jgi:pimeloyl-ACP methyl ester carboxylesterase
LSSGTEASQTICDSRALAAAVFQQYNTGLPISITRIANATGRPTYLLMLAGTEFSSKQSNNGITDGFEALNIASEYDNAVMNAIIQRVPAGSDLIMVGHSLGGMVAQNLARRFARTNNFGGQLRVTNLITFGSPKTGADVPGINYKRFIVFGDPVPNLTSAGNQPTSGVTILDANQQRMQAIGSLSYIPALAEHLMYPQNAQLAGYDALGNLDGGACLQLDARRWTFVAPAGSN